MTTYVNTGGHFIAEFIAYFNLFLIRLKKEWRAWYV